MTKYDHYGEEVKELLHKATKKVRKLCGHEEVEKHDVY